MRAARSRARAVPQGGTGVSAAASSGAQSTVATIPRASVPADGESPRAAAASTVGRPCGATPAKPRIDQAEPVADMFWGDHFSRVTDPFSVRWRIAAHLPEDASPRRSAVAQPSLQADLTQPVREPLAPRSPRRDLPWTGTDSTDHLPWNRGSRFSRKAATPSRWSSVRPQRRCVIASRLRSVRKSPVAAMFTFSFM